MLFHFKIIFFALVHPFIQHSFIKDWFCDDYLPSTFRISFVSHHNILGMCSHPQVPDGKTKEAAGRWWTEDQPSLAPQSWELRSPSALPSLVPWLSHKDRHRVTEERSRQSQASHRGTVVFSAPARGPSGSTNRSTPGWASAARGSRASGGVAGAARGGSDQARKADQNARLHCRRQAGSCCAHACGVGPQLLPWASQGLCRVLLEPISCPEGQLAFLPDNASPSVAPAYLTAWKTLLSENKVLPPFLPPPRGLPAQPTWHLTLWSLTTPFAGFIFSFEHACWCFSMLSYLWLDFTEGEPASWGQRAVLFEAGSLGPRMSNRANGLSYHCTFSQKLVLNFFVCALSRLDKSSDFQT